MSRHFDNPDYDNNYSDIQNTFKSNFSGKTMDIPTAKEFYLHTTNIDGIENYMIEFTKLHLEEYKKKIFEKTELWDDCAVIPRESIENIYPFENVK